MMAGALVGGQRAKADHPAGLRTHAGGNRLCDCHDRRQHAVPGDGAAVRHLARSGKTWRTGRIRRWISRRGNHFERRSCRARTDDGCQPVGGSLFGTGCRNGVLYRCNHWRNRCVCYAVCDGIYQQTHVPVSGTHTGISGGMCGDQPTISEIERVFQQFHLPLEQVSFGRMDEMCCWIRFCATVSGTNSLQKQEALLENLAQLPSVDMLQMEREKRSGYSGSAAAGWHGSEAK